MTRYTGGETVKSGFYWNPRHWAVTLVEHQGGVLPGEHDERYLRLPVLAMLLVAPIMGALYVVFLPFIGFAMVLDYVARRVGRRAKAGAVSLLGAVTPHWRPGEAYLAEERKDEASDDADAPKTGTGRDE